MLESKYLAFDHSYAIEWKECESSMEVLSATLLPILRDRETSATRPCGSKGRGGGDAVRKLGWGVCLETMLDDARQAIVPFSAIRYTPLIVIAFCGSLLTQRAQENETACRKRSHTTGSASGRFFCVIRSSWSRFSMVLL